MGSRSTPACGSRSSRSPRTAGASSCPSCGASAPARATRRPTSIDDYAGDTIDLLDALHIETAVICGLSMGGYAAFAMFRHAPRYFHAMVLADTKSQGDSAEAVAGRKGMQQLVREKGQAAVADALLPKLVGDTTRRERPDVIDDLRRQITGNSVESIAGALDALMTRPDSTPTLGTIHCPFRFSSGMRTRSRRRPSASRCTGTSPAPSWPSSRGRPHVEHGAASTVQRRARTIPRASGIVGCTAMLGMEIMLPFRPAKAGRYVLIVLLLAAFAVPSAQESAPVPQAVRARSAA